MFALALLTLVPLWRCIVGGENIGAWDEVRQMAPWNDTRSSAPWDVLQADSVLQFYGWRDQVFKAWGSNHLPLWNSGELGGTPLLANSQSGGFYLPHVICGLLHFPTAPAMALLAWFHLLWAGVGVYCLCRRLGGAQSIAFLAGAGFALSSFMLAWAMLPSVIETVSWIPWILLGVYGLPSRKGILILTGSVAMCLYAGHLQFAAYALMAGGLAWLVRLVQERKQWKMMLLSGAFGLSAGVLISGPQLVPVLDFGKHSHRTNSPTAEGYEAYNVGALPAWQLLSIPDSQLLGLPTSAITVDGAQVNGFWPALIQRGGNFAESAIGVGPVILLLLVLGLRRAKLGEAAGIGFVGVRGLLLAFGTPLGALLYYGVPHWSATGSPGRAEILFVLAACVLAGSWNPESDPLPTKSLRDRSLIFAVIAVICAGVIFRLPLSSWIPGLSVEDLYAAIPHGAMAGQTLLLALCALAVGIASLRAPRFLIFSVAILGVLLLPAGIHLIRSSPDRHPEDGGSIGRLAIVNGAWDLLQTPKALMPPNTAGLSGQDEIGGYDSIIDKRTRDQLADIDGEDPAPPANGNMMFVKRNLDAVKLADAGVSDVWSLNPLPQLGAAPEPRNGIYKYKLPGPGRAYLTSGPATVSHETADSIEIEASGPGTLTLKDRLTDGWHVAVDDTPEKLSLDPWPQVAVPRGRHTIRFHYWPHGITVGFDYMLVGLVIIALYLAGFKRYTAGPKDAVVQ